MSQTPFVFGRRATLRLSFFAGLAPIVVFAIGPAVAIVVISFTDVRSLPFLPVQWVGLQNYVTFFSAANLAYNMHALLNTLVFAVAVTIAQNVIALLLAVYLNRRLRGRTFLRAVVFLPTILGVTVIGLIWSLIFNPSGGPAASIWSWFNTTSAFFGDPKMALWLVIFVQVWSGIGVAMIIYLAGLQAISSDFYEAADIDGATSWQKLRRITYPLLAPSVTANMMLCIIGSLQSYQLIYVLTGANDPATQVLSLAIFSQGFGGSTAGGGVHSQGYAAAISMVQFVLVAVISILVFGYLRRREERL